MSATKGTLSTVSPLSVSNLIGVPDLGKEILNPPAIPLYPVPSFAEASAIFIAILSLPVLLDKEAL